MVLDEAEVVHKVTIVPRGQAGGYAMMLPKQDRFLMTEPELLDKICGLLGGRVSEDINLTKYQQVLQMTSNVQHKSHAQWLH